MNRLIIVALIFVVAFASSTAKANAAELPFPDWTAVFDSDGSIKDLAGGIDAVYIQENISAGLATDMTALDSTNGFVFNGPVAKAHDLGNSYAYAKRDELGNLVVVAAAERLNTTADTFIEFEFNQGVVGVDSGAPWPIVGAKTVNDVLVRLDFVAGNIISVTLKKWDGNDFVTTQSASVPAQTGCFVVAPSVLDFCNGTPVAGLPATNTDIWDSEFRKVSVDAADDFVQVSVDIGQDIEISSIAARTPEDVILGSFRAMGYWKSLDNALAGQ